MLLVIQFSITFASISTAISIFQIVQGSDGQEKKAKSSDDPAVPIDRLATIFRLVVLFLIIETC